MQKNLIFLFVLFSILCFPAEVFSKSEGRDYWVDRYLSVSYPLKKIKVNSPFGGRKDPFTGERSVHSGLDLDANYEEVYSMFDGVVEKVGSDSRSGNFVILRHGDYTISYCHLSKATVNEGEEFIAGDVMGYSGNSGRSTGPHLHITCKHKGKVVDPYTLLIYVKAVREEAVLALGGKITKGSSVNCEEFLSLYAHAAMEQQKKYGIPSSVTLAQMAYESGWGQSELATIGKNFFGIKCSREWLAAGKPYSLHDDDKPNEKFCNYASADESIDHHSRLLMGDRYKECRKYSSTDYHRWLVALKSAGYATSKDYVQSCEKIIKRYKLYMYDKIASKA